ncbi:ATP-dependent zinc protease [Candidatus Dojkabacteria bacterium]|nr:ATP-dependent zinc protease [Candidatus Dojkabacteria bacterium]
MSLATILNNRKKILGLNERNLKYIRPFNKKKAKLIADNKLLTKKYLEKAGIPIPKLLAVIKNEEELENFDWDSLPKSFVVKPVMGHEGGGIEIFYNKDNKGRWIRADKSKVNLSELKAYIFDILDGKYSLHNTPDMAFFEERVKLHKRFRYHTYKGAPDVRINIFNNIPIMAYIRFPTRESRGKANMAMGAIGTGIDMASGVTTTSVYGKGSGGRGTPIECVPGTKIRLAGLKIPYWNKMLRYAIEVQKITKLGYAAVDFLLDRDLGPLVVEINARPGLSGQIANQDGLAWRLKKVAGLKIKTVEKGVRLAKDLFGGEIEEEIESISGKEVIGIYETVILIGKEGKELERKAKIDTGADSTSIDIELIKQLGYEDLVKEIESKAIPDNMNRDEGLELARKLEADLLPKYPEIAYLAYIKSSHGTSVRPSIKISLRLGDTQFETTATIYDRSKLTYPVIVGRKSLSRFLVDPTKTRPFSGEQKK